VASAKRPVAPDRRAKPVACPRASADSEKARSVVSRPEDTNKIALSRRDALLAALAAPLVMRDAPALAETKKRAGAAGSAPPTPEAAFASLRTDIEKLMAKDGDFGPTMVRLAWHSSGTYDKMSKTGGNGGGTIRFKEELAHGGNAGLDKAVAKLEPIHRKHPTISYADLFAYVGVVAIETMGGPKLKFSYGRVDEMDPSAVTPDGRLPNADVGDGPGPKERDHLRKIFGRMGEFIFGYFWLFLVIFVWAISMTSCFVHRFQGPRDCRALGRARSRSMPRGRLRVRRSVVRYPAPVQQQLLRPAQGSEVGAKRRGG
jgi:cytochrome c peroxidase